MPNLGTLQDVVAYGGNSGEYKPTEIHVPFWAKKKRKDCIVFDLHKKMIDSIGEMNAKIEELRDVNCGTFSNTIATRRLSIHWHH